VQLDEDECLYINGILVNCAISGVTVSDDMATLSEGETATLRYTGGAALPGEKVAIKVVTLRGTPAEKHVYPAGSVNGPIMWNRTYGGTGNEAAYSLVATSDGGYALAGTTFSFGGGGHSFWLVKTDAFGNMEWNQTYEGGSSCSSLVETSDGGYALAGTTDSLDGGHDFYLVKTDSSGNMMWSQTYGGPDHDDSCSLVATSDGGYAIAGGTFSFGAGNEDFWLVKTDASGNMEWNQTYGGTNSERPRSLVLTSDGGYAIAGYTNSLGDGHLICWLVKVDASGNAEWGETYEGAGQGLAESLVATSDGGYIMAGRTRASDVDFHDFWLIKTNASGNVEWNGTYGGESQDNQAYSVVETSDGGYAFVGATMSFSAEDNGSWLVKTDVSGNMEWHRIYRGGVCVLVEASDGGYALAGGRNNDFWLVKTDSLGNTE
jgi:hypothetical protein